MYQDCNHTHNKKIKKKICYSLKGLGYQLVVSIIYNIKMFLGDVYAGECLETDRKSPRTRETLQSGCANF